MSSLITLIKEAQQLELEAFAEIEARLTALEGVPPAPEPPEPNPDAPPPDWVAEWTAPDTMAYLMMEQNKAQGSGTRCTIMPAITYGRPCVKLTTKAGDNNVHGSGDMERSDLYHVMGSGGAPLVFGEGEDQWWSLSILFPDNFQFPTWHNYNLFSFHQESGHGANQWHGFFQADPANDANPGILRLEGAGGGSPDAPAVRWGGDILRQPIARNQWLELVWHVKWTSGNSGFTTLWLNGEKKVHHEGPTKYDDEGCYLKLANYHTPVCDPYPACVGGPSHYDSSVCYGPMKRGPTIESVGWYQVTNDWSRIAPIQQSRGGRKPHKPRHGGRAFR
jgi:hypothetical protein